MCVCVHAHVQVGGVCCGNWEASLSTSCMSASAYIVIQPQTVGHIWTITILRHVQCIYMYTPFGAGDLHIPSLRRCYILYIELSQCILPLYLERESSTALNL